MGDGWRALGFLVGACALGACSGTTGTADGAVVDSAAADGAADTAVAADTASPPDTLVPGDTAVPPDAARDGAPVCPVPGDTTSCALDGDCAMVARGCYCGQQPVEGVTRGAFAAVAACEAVAAGSCALGCANMPGQRAQDGRSADDGGVLAVRCARDGGAGACQTFVR
ncbi:MAG: hypothetical protein HY909_21005 [Deltaproteobacteria bacterium]|nr:hypothetical protein [Deltaproteobacteria bacterium]